MTHKIIFIELEKSLEHCLKDNIPVLALVAIIGTTEEGAIDLVEAIWTVREQFRRKVASISVYIIADVQWMFRSSWDLRNKNFLLIYCIRMIISFSL